MRPSTQHSSCKLAGTPYLSPGSPSPRTRALCQPAPSCKEPKGAPKAWRRQLGGGRRRRQWEGAQLRRGPRLWAALQVLHSIDRAAPGKVAPWPLPHCCRRPALAAGADRLACVLAWILPVSCVRPIGAGCCSGCLCSGLPPLRCFLSSRAAHTDRNKLDRVHTASADCPPCPAAAALPPAHCPSTSTGPRSSPCDCGTASIYCVILPLQPMRPFNLTFEPWEACIPVET